MNTLGVNVGGGGNTLEEALAMVENNHKDLSKIFIATPDPNVLTDDDSGDKEGGLVDNLIGRQLREELKRRQRSLRDSYVLYIRVIKTRNEQAAQNKIWQWAESMKMFQPFLIFAKTFSNVPIFATQLESVTEKDNGVDVSGNEESEFSDLFEVLLPTEHKKIYLC
ncbi:unnamed protein product [Diabrotica balteata]|uniref:Uncharacterized protein n=1 Tax=Diabrotica balteata TaxID=107213 RepID=A0A9N9TD50_DIABA|nr:unnamed protein product [Diabrotica balteata]